jgi:GAF domain-containing protein
MIATERVLNAFVEVADTLVDDFDLIDFLHNLADHTAAVSGVSSVGLLLGDENQPLHYMAASTAGAKNLELFQIQSAEGPCLDCVKTRQAVIVPDLEGATDRWPVFVPRALQAGIRSVHAFPLRLRDRVIGALNVFGEETLPLDENDVLVIQALADIATIAIIQERALSAAETLTEQLQGALNSRIIIEQAKGVVAQSRRLEMDRAFALLRSHAREHHVRLTDLAHGVVTGSIDPGTLGATQPDGPA